MPALLGNNCCFTIYGGNGPSGGALQKKINIRSFKIMNGQKWGALA